MTTSRVPTTTGLTRIAVRRDTGVVTVTLNRPEKKNATDIQTWEELRATFREIAGNAEDRAVVLCGAGGDFCAGNDLWEQGQEHQHPLVRMRRIADTILQLHELPQPTVAKITGAAVGVGLNLALACDLVVAANDARLSEIFAKRGLSVDGGGSWQLPRRVGIHRAKELLFFADMVSGQDAGDLGLINRAVPGDEIDAFVDGWARRLAAGPPLALSISKKLVQESMSVSFAQALEAEGLAAAMNWTSEDVREALAAYSERREPHFHGR